MVSGVIAGMRLRKIAGNGMAKHYKEKRSGEVGRRRADIRDEQIRQGTKIQLLERELSHGKSTLTGIREVSDLLVTQVQRIKEKVGESEATQLANHNAFEKRMFDKQNALLRWIVMTLLTSAGGIAAVVLEWYLSR